MEITKSFQRSVSNKNGKMNLAKKLPKTIRTLQSIEYTDKDLGALPSFRIRKQSNRIINATLSETEETDEVEYNKQNKTS